MTIKTILVFMGCFAIVMALLAICMWFPAQPPVHAASQFATIVCDNYKAVSAAAGTQLIATAGNSNMFVYVCSMTFGSIGGSSFSVIEGGGATCATNTLAMAGGTTAAGGFGVAANGSPVSAGSGVGAIMKTAVAGDNVCVISAGTGPLAGTMAFTQAPY